MRSTTVVLLMGGFLVVASSAGAQPPPGRQGGRGEGGSAVDVGSSVSRMMAFDKDQDGKLTKDEVTDPRLQSLFGRADSDKDDLVTKEELTAFFTREAATLGPEGRGGPPGGPGGPGGGRGGPRGPGGPRQPGQVLPSFMQEMLGLSDDQKKQVAELQKEVDARLGTILTADQKQQLQAMRDRGPGGFGPPPGRPGGPNDGPGRPGPRPGGPGQP